jgi:hypothetical protein
MQCACSLIYHIHLSSHATTTDPFQATDVAASPSRNDYAVTYRQQCWASLLYPCRQLDFGLDGIVSKKNPASPGNQVTVIQTANLF